MKLPTIKEVKKWSRALRSGKYKQGFGALQSDKNEYCCLGVACVEFIPTNKLLRTHSLGFMRGSFPAFQPEAPEWLKSIDRGLADKIGFRFSSLNDEQQLSFDEIADVLELVYLYNRDTDFTVKD